MDPDLARWREREAAEMRRCARRLRRSAEVTRAGGNDDRARIFEGLADQFQAAANRIKDGLADELRAEWQEEADR